MKHSFIALCLLPALFLTQQSHAQGSLEAGRELLSRLSSAEVRKALTLKKDKLSFYVGRTRVGSLTMETVVVGKALVLTDSFEMRIVGLGQVSLESKQTIDEKGHLVEAEMSTRAPRPSGKLITRKYILRRKEGYFQWRRTVQGKSEELKIDAPPHAIALLPPVGLAARLPKAIKSADRWAFVAIDMKTGSKTRLKLTADPFEDHAFRTHKVSTRLVSRREAGTELSSLYDQAGSLLQISFQDKRLLAAGGLTDEERFRSLPEVVKGLPKDPVSTVIVFFRSVAKGLEEEAKACLDFDALFEALKNPDEKSKPEQRKRFETLFMEQLAKMDWLRDRRLSVNSNALEPSEMTTKIRDKEARVYLPGGGGVRLLKHGDLWKIAGFLKAKK